MKINNLFFGIIGMAAVAILAVQVDMHSLTAMGVSKINDIDVTTKEIVEIPKKKNLLGTYIVKNDKNSKLTFNDDGTYVLTINVCEKYLDITGTYEIRDSKIKLYNSEYSYDDLNNNEELTFTIIDEKTLKSDESLVCTPQETLFEK